MKKLIAYLLTFVIVLGLCACTGSAGGAEETQAPQGLQIGYARESLLPNGNVNMSGYGNQQHRVSTGYLDIIAATCIAASDGKTTVLLFSTDTLNAKTNWTAEARNLISQATGVPGNNIQVGATHTHSSGAVGGSEELTLQWKTVYMDALVNAAKKAIADMAPAKIYGSTIQTEGMTYVRHYEMLDGSFCGDNFGDPSKGYKGHATTANELMMMIKFDREGDKKDIAVMNFQFHPCFTGGGQETVLSADGVAAIRDVFEKETGMHFIYFTGSAGNQNASSRLPNENQNRKGANQMKKYGEELYQYAAKAMENLEEIGGTTVVSKQETLTYKSNKYGLERLADAQKATDLFRQTGDSSSASTLAKSMGFHSVFECNGIVANAGRPATYDMELNVVRIGDLGFVAAPYEMFSDSAFQIRDGSPFKYTLISTITNNSWGYFATEKAYGYGCYESFTASFDSGIAETTAAKFVDMLKGI